MDACWPKGYKIGRRPVFTVLDRMIATDLLKTLLSVWTVLVVIIVSQKFIKILEKAVEGHIANDTLMTILGLKTIIVGIFLLPAATFMALLMVLGKLYKDHEMSAIAAAGGGPETVYKAIFILIIPFSALTLMLSMVTAPWAETRMQNIVNQDEQSSDIRGIAAGKFSQYSGGDLVFYVEKITADNEMHAVFLQKRNKNNLGIISSEKSHFKDLPGGRYIVFENGEHIQGHPGDYNYVIENFKEYAVKIEEKALSSWLPPKAKASAQLWQATKPSDIVELQNRIAVPLTILLFSFIAVPLAKASPRGGVYGSILMGFLIYICHGNFSGVIQSWIIKGAIPMWPGIFWVNIALFISGLALLANWYGFKWVQRTLKSWIAS